MKEPPKSPRIAIADCIIDVPELRVHRFELSAELVRHRAIYVAEANGPQCLELVHDILELGRVLDALGLYFEDRDLVHQLTDRDRHQDVVWRRVVRGGHDFSSAFAAARQTIPPVAPTPRTHTHPRPN